jgi:hypothetical protein
MGFDQFANLKLGKMKMKVISTVKEKFLLSENAKLFDTKEYLFKTFIAVIIAGIIGSEISYVSKDMISLLFGMMLTLEPVNMSGIRSGLSQIEATIIGAVVTGVVLAIMGYGILATAIGITLTLYVCMLINWRELMVVAVFTSIYMTQYIQTDALGNASSIETLKLRLTALGAGVLVAFIVNFIFSLLGYKKMVNKRIYYISKELYERSFELKDAIAHKSDEEVEVVMSKFPSLFTSIDWIAGTLADVKEDQRRFKIVYRHFDADVFLNYSTSLRGITHVMYDLCHRISTEQSQYYDEEFVLSYEERLSYFGAVNEAFYNHKELPKASWEVTKYSWLNQYSKALEKLNS